MPTAQSRRRSLIALMQGAILVGALFATSAAPVAAQDTSAAPASAGAATVPCTLPGEKKTYGYISPGPDTWYQRDVDGFTFGAQKDGNDVVVLNSQYDPEKEIANIESLINQGVDGISMFSSTTAGAVLAAKRGQEAGIPVVVTDSVGTVIDQGQPVVAAIDFDWEGMGRAYADWMAQTYPGDKFAILTGFFDSPPSQLINKGMTERAKELGKNELVTIQETKYSPDTAVSLARDLVLSGQDIGLMFVMDEDMASAVIRMLKNEGYLDNPVKVFAQNGSPAGIPLLKDGTLKYTISSSPGWEGLIAYLALDQYVNGCTTEMNQRLVLPVIPVTEANVDDPAQVVSWEPSDIYWQLAQQYFPALMAGRTAG
jgi:ribose transport system substrate-binding protein